MKMQIMIHTHTHTHTHSPVPHLFLSGTNGSQLRDSAFAAQAFLEVRTKQGCVVKVHDQRGRGHLQGCHLCVLTPPQAGIYKYRRFSDRTCMNALHWFFSCVCMCMSIDASVLVHVCGCCIVCMWYAVIHSQCIRLLCT